MKSIIFFICVVNVIFAQNFTFKEQKYRNNTRWVINYPKPQSGVFVCRLLFRDKDEIIGSRLWLRFEKRNFSYVYSTNNRRILKGKYTLEILQQNAHDKKQSVPKSYDFYIGTPKEVVEQHYQYTKQLLAFCNHLKQSNTALKAESLALQKESTEEQVIKWCRDKRKVLKKWHRKINIFFYPHAITSYNYPTQQNSHRAISILKNVIDLYREWMISAKTSEKLPPNYNLGMAEKLSSLLKKIEVLADKMYVCTIESEQNINDLLDNLNNLKLTSEHKVNLRLQQLIFQEKKHLQVVVLLKKIESLISTKLEGKEKETLEELITQTRDAIKELTPTKSDENYFSSTLKQLRRTKGLNQFSTEDLKMLEKKVSQVQDNKHYRSFLGLIYWIKVYKMYIKESEGSETEIYVEKSKLNIKLLVEKLQSSL